MHIDCDSHFFPVKFLKTVSALATRICNGDDQTETSAAKEL
jgi:hypothetical protein